MTKSIIFSIALFLTGFSAFGQHQSLSFKEAKMQGNLMINLDSKYRSAIHADTSLAVFKSDLEQDRLQQAYYKLLMDFGDFLFTNNFKWDKLTRCFNKIYFNADGSIDYFLFNFLGSAENLPNEEKQKEFQRLLNLFSIDYQFTLTANTKFSQCSPSTFVPTEK